jgi:hypothetical protein
VSRVRAGQAEELLGERDPSAAGLATREATHQQPNHDWPSGDGRVGQPAVVAAVHPARFDAAARTRHLVPPIPGFNNDPAVSLVDPVDRDLD